MSDLRSTIINAIQATAATGDWTPDAAHIYISPSIRKALVPSCSLVIGGSGMGKSCLAHALCNYTPSSAFGVEWFKTNCATLAFSAKDAPAFLKSLRDGMTPFDAWALACGINPQAFSQSASYIDRANSEVGAQTMCVIDGVEALADDQEHPQEFLNEVVTALLQVVAKLNQYSSMHFKVFLRPETFERVRGKSLEAQQLYATSQELTWRAHDLHALLWHYLVNSESSDLVRGLNKQLTQSTLCTDGKEAVWLLSRKMQMDTDLQQELFALLAGSSMSARSKNSGYGTPYRWLSTHLADAHGNFTPCSFLAAIRAAAMDSKENHADHQFALHTDSLKRSVQAAAAVRAAQLNKSHPLAHQLALALKGLSLPVTPEEITAAWKDADVQERSQELAALGVFDIMRDGRVNMTEIHRLGFGLGRHGGVKQAA